jgi:RimJ/RimL family protein N-acetyltransferase
MTKTKAPKTKTPGPPGRKPRPARWLPLETPRLILRDMRESDFDAIHAYASDLEVVRFMNWGPNTPEVTRQVLDGWLKQARRWPRSGVTMAVHHKALDRLIGTIRFGLWDEANGTGDVGYVFDRGYWNQGYCSEAAGAVVKMAFETLGLRRMLANCDVRNTGSWRVMEKLGMRREALFRQDVKAHDGWRDSYQYAVLASEWTSRAGEN